MWLWQAFRRGCAAGVDLRHRSEVSGTRPSRVPTHHPNTSSTVTSSPKFSLTPTPQTTQPEQQPRSQQVSRYMEIASL